MDKFVFFTNRASSVFRLALEKWGGSELRDGGKEVDLLYFDAYGGKRLSPGIEVRYQLIERSRTIPLDHKVRLAKRLNERGAQFPQSYFKIEDVPADSSSPWYVKDPLSTGGKRVFLVPYADLARVFQDGYLIQEAVQNVALLNGRKFTMRSYVLVHNGVVYMYPESILVIHGMEYDCENLDPAVHFLHEGYHLPNAGVRLLPSDQYDEYRSTVDEMRGVIQKTFSAFEPELNISDASRYCIFGLDLLHTTAGKVALIEVNDRPNFVHTNLINEKINSKMIEALLEVLRPDLVSRPLDVSFQEVFRYG